MLKLHSKNDENKYAVFLDHRQLIKDVYSEAMLHNETYELKSQLFQFLPKVTELQLKPKQKKRKRKLNEDITTDDAEMDNITEYLTMLPKAIKSNELLTLPRFWETEYNIPQLHGSNVSGIFQSFPSNGNNFIIPHDTRFYNHNVDQLTALLPQLLPSYDLIIIDPPWRNKYIRRLKRAKQELGYTMLENDQLAQLPIGQLIHKHTLVAIWCTNSALHQQTLETQILTQWKLRLLHKLRWYKLNTHHELISDPAPRAIMQKQPYELLYLACHTNSDNAYAEELKRVDLLLSVPSIVHSHKPPLLKWLIQHLQLAPGQTKPNCLELFARYLQPQFTSIGLEVLKLMDERLYEKII